MHRFILSIFLASLATIGLLAQERVSNPLKLDEIKALHGAGLPAADLLAMLNKCGSVTLDAAAVQQLRTEGLPEPVLQWLNARLPKAAKVALTLAEVKNLLKAGLPEAELLGLIASSNSRFDISAEDLIGLIREGVPPGILKAMRERGATTAIVTAVAQPVTLDDILSMSAGGITAEEMLRRIKAADTHYDIDIDGVLRLTRNSVPKEVVKEVWARRNSAATNTAQATSANTGAPGNAANSGGSTLNPEASGSAAVAPITTTNHELTLHREAEGGYSIMVPRGWFLHRERAGANGLVSFTDTESPGPCGLADCELQVFRSRATNPERLTETNLEPIAANFLNRLQASFAGRKVSFSFGSPSVTRSSGRAAVVYKVASAAADGTTHEGEVIVTLRDDQVFVISWAVRAEQLAAHGARIAACAQSFDITSDPGLEAVKGKDEDQITSVFGVWRTALLSSDWSLALKVLPEGADTIAARAQFAELTRKCVQPGASLALGGLRCEGDKASAQFTLNGADALTVAFTRDAKGWRIQP
ncbi:MAG: hypothetical protein EXS14_01640 [Planctomycetes bacterium]|nr:hypothetical protein [Planctomycetota bacterium]